MKLNLDESKCVAYGLSVQQFVHTLFSPRRLIVILPSHGLLSTKILLHRLWWVYGLIKALPYSQRYVDNFFYRFWLSKRIVGGSNLYDPVRRFFGCDDLNQGNGAKNKRANRQKKGNNNQGQR